MKLSSLIFYFICLYFFLFFNIAVYSLFLKQHLWVTKLLIIKQKAYNNYQKITFFNNKRHATEHICPQKGCFIGIY